MAEPRKAAEPSTPRPAAMAPALPEQVEVRGYVISEDKEMALRDTGVAMNALAHILDEAGENLPELPGSDYAALFRTFSRQVLQTTADAGYTTRAMVRPRQVH